MPCQNGSAVADSGSNRACVVLQPDERLAGQQEVPVVQAHPQAEDRRPEDESVNRTRYGSRNRYGVTRIRSAAVAERVAAALAPAWPGRRSGSLAPCHTVLLACSPGSCLARAGRVGQCLGRLGLLQHRLVDRLVQLGHRVTDARRPTAGSAGRRSASPRAACSVSALNSARLADLLAGRHLAALGPLQRLLADQFRTPGPRCDLFWSGVFSLGSTNWCEPAQAALVPPMFGSGATPHSRPFFSLSVLMVQMPFQLKAFLPFSAR